MKKQIKEKCDKDKVNVSEMTFEDRKARVEKVASILKTVPYITESDRLQSTLAFARSSLNEQEIQFIASTLKPEYRNTKESQIYKKGIM